MSKHGSTGKSKSAFIFFVMTRKTAIQSLTVVGEYCPALMRASHESRHALMSERDGLLFVDLETDDLVSEAGPSSR
jgi:hypothetical protein